MIPLRTLWQAAGDEFQESPRKAAEAGKETTSKPQVPTGQPDSLACWRGAETWRAGQPAPEPSYLASKDAAEDARMSDLGTLWKMADAGDIDAIMEREAIRFRLFVAALPFALATVALIAAATPN